MSTENQNLTDKTREEIYEALTKIKAITPASLAAEIGVTLSEAKRLLTQLENEEKILLSAKSHNVKVYRLK
jgi:ribosomal protein S25